MSKQENTRTQEEQAELNEQLLNAFYSNEVNLDELNTAIQKGADVNTKEPYGNYLPLLVRAVVLDSKDAVSALIDAGADVNAQDTQGNTALHQLAFSPYMNNITRDQIFGALIKKPGANLDAANNKGYTPLMIAATKGNKDVANLLLEHGADPTPLYKEDTKEPKPEYAKWPWVQACCEKYYEQAMAKQAQHPGVIPVGDRPTGLPFGSIAAFLPPSEAKRLGGVIGEPEGAEGTRGGKINTARWTEGRQPSVPGGR